MLIFISQSDLHKSKYFRSKKKKYSHFQLNKVEKIVETNKQRSTFVQICEVVFKTKTNKYFNFRTGINHNSFPLVFVYILFFVMDLYNLNSDKLLG